MLGLENLTVGGMIDDLIQTGIGGIVKITEAYTRAERDLVFLCDVSPPRGASSDFIEEVRALPVDFLSVAYAPGKSIRADSAMTAATLAHSLGANVIFTVATRDMNKLALQSYILGAHLLGLENLLVVRGDDFEQGQEAPVRAVHDFTPTDLLLNVQRFNKGYDFRGRALDHHVNLCPGASLDLANDIGAEVRLAVRKVRSGAEFFVAQPVYETRRITEFLELYTAATGGIDPPPTFYGVQVLQRHGVAFGNPPLWIRDQLDRGRSGIDIAQGLIQRFSDLGVRGVYLIPPILSGGVRDYGAARHLLSKM